MRVPIYYSIHFKMKFILGTVPVTLLVLLSVPRKVPGKVRDSPRFLSSEHCRLILTMHPVSDSWFYWLPVISFKSLCPHVPHKLEWYTLHFFHEHLCHSWSCSQDVRLDLRCWLQLISFFSSFCPGNWGN